MSRRTYDEEFQNGDDGDTVNCPYCRAPMYADSPRCPACGQYISKEDLPAERKPWWILVGAALCLYAVYRWVLRRD